MYLFYFILFHFILPFASFHFISIPVPVPVPVKLIGR